MTKRLRRAPYIIAVLVLLLVLQCVGVWIPGIDVGFFLAVGWVPFLRRVVPKLQVRWDLVASTVVYAAALAIGLHLFLRWLYREVRKPAAGVGDAPASGPRAWPWRWTFGLVALVLVMFAAGTAAVGIVHQTTWLVRSPEPLYQPNRGRERANRIKCASNLREIAQAIGLYAERHDGKLPDGFAPLLADGGLDARVFICPASDDEEVRHAASTQPADALLGPGHCSYVYLGKGLDTSADGSKVIAVEPLENHGGGGMNVLYGDQRVEWLDGSDAERLLLSLGFERVPAPATRR